MSCININFVTLQLMYCYVYLPESISHSIHFQFIIYTFSAISGDSVKIQLFYYPLVHIYRNINKEYIRVRQVFISGYIFKMSKFISFAYRMVIQLVTVFIKVYAPFPLFLHLYSIHLHDFTRLQTPPHMRWIPIVKLQTQQNNNLKTTVGGYLFDRNQFPASMDCRLSLVQHDETIVLL